MPSRIRIALSFALATTTLPGLAARAQELDQAEAFGIIIRLPRVEAPAAAPVRPLRALRTAQVAQ